MNSNLPKIEFTDSEFTEIELSMGLEDFAFHEGKSEPFQILQQFAESIESVLDFQTQEEQDLFFQQLSPQEYDEFLLAAKIIFSFIKIREIIQEKKKIVQFLSCQKLMPDNSLAMLACKQKESLTFLLDCFSFTFLPYYDYETDEGPIYGSLQWYQNIDNSKENGWILTLEEAFESIFFKEFLPQDIVQEYIKTLEIFLIPKNSFFQR